MATITTRREWIQQLARGRGLLYAGRSVCPASNTTAAAAGSGFLTVQLEFNIPGTTLPGTLQGHVLPPVTPELLCHYSSIKSFARGFWLVRLYLLGTLNLTALGNQFTHASTFTELRRTRFGVVDSPISLLPLVHFTTATSVTAPFFRLRNVAGAAGYTNQAGAAVVATASQQMPAAATTVNSCYILRLENGDSGVRDISNIEVTLASSTGAASVFGVELLSGLTTLVSGNPGVSDNLLGGLGAMDLQPAVPNSGVVSSYLAVMHLGSATTDLNVQGHLFSAVLNNL